MLYAGSGDFAYQLELGFDADPFHTMPITASVRVPLRRFRSPSSLGAMAPLHIRLSRFFVCPASLSWLVDGARLGAALPYFIGPRTFILS